MKARYAFFALAALTAGCAPQITTGSNPGDLIVTPSGPTYVYSWTMLHDHEREGVQVGPKYDANGAHVSVYWWIGCAGAYLPCQHEGYQQLDPLTPGSVHAYSLPECDVNTYCPTVDGRVVARVTLPYPPPIREVGSEVTAS